MARNSLLCADVPLRNYSLTHLCQLHCCCTTKTVVDMTLTHVAEIFASFLALISGACVTGFILYTLKADT